MCADPPYVIFRNNSPGVLWGGMTYGHEMDSDLGGMQLDRRRGEITADEVSGGFYGAGK